MEFSTTVVASVVFASLFCVSVGQSYVDDDQSSELAAPLDIDACTWCQVFPTSDACALCFAEESDSPPALQKRNGEFYRSSRSSCNCCFISRFTNAVCCDTCNSLNGGLYKRSQSPVVYHPLFRGGYLKKSKIYNPLLRGGFKRSNGFYHPFLRGGFQPVPNNGEVF